MKWENGDILRGREGSNAKHPIVFLHGHNDSFFIGGMITHAETERYPDNILMKSTFFIFDNPADNEEDIFLVKAKLLKRIEWQPFRKIGHLTEEGLLFVESNISDKNHLLWEEYRKMSGR